MAMPGWIRAFPNAKVFASPGLPERRKDIKFDATLTDEPEAAWANELDQVCASVGVRVGWMGE